MNFKKITAAIAAAAIAVSTLAVSAFATTVEIDAEYPGSWTSSGTGITKADLEAVGGDVKIVLTVETYNPYGLADQFLVNPIDYDNGWISQTVEYCTSDTITAKTDGWICVRESDTTLEFVYDQAGIAALGDDGLCFSVQNVIVKSAEYSLADSKQGELNLVDDATGKAYCFSTADDTATADAAEETVEDAAPAADTAATTSATTGNTTAAVIVSVMAAAGVAAVASRKRK
ncbi:MAG: hypothetical protein LUI05_08090 [Oscillospiraceae bacterium]|nr:hypothetical protein [Oscillospiraceae bacterium]